MAAETVRVKGFGKLRSSLQRIDSETAKQLNDVLREAAQIVADNARGRFAGIDSRSAAGFRPNLRGFRKVRVQQSIRKTTGLHPEFGSLQMRVALIPALSEKQPQIFASVEHMLDRVIERYG